MAMVVLLLRDGGADLSVGPQALAQLASLGITNVAVLRDGESFVIVLDGWSFDVGSAAAAATAVAGPGNATKTFHPIAQTAVSAAHFEGGHNAEADGVSTPRTRGRSRSARKR
jgi:hypothetical protein